MILIELILLLNSIKIQVFGFFINTKFKQTKPGSMFIMCRLRYYQLAYTGIEIDQETSATFQ
jgi:hypothetical protein